MSGYFSRKGHPRFLVGVNYWPAKTGPLMWRKWDAEAVRSDVVQMKELGINSFRSFLFFPDFMPHPDFVDPVMLDRLCQFLEICREEDVQTAVSLFVGHMSGENWDVPWRNSRDFYADPWMLEQERFYVRSVAAPFAGDAAVLAWILSNEITLYAGNPNPAAARHWLETMMQAIRAVDSTHPIGTGDGGPVVAGPDSGLSLPLVDSLMDFTGPHAYQQDTDALRYSYAPSALVKMMDAGKPVILEEFGCSTAQTSEEAQAGYFRSTMHSAFTAGAAGVWGWCFSDFDLPMQRPYAHHAHEMRFGIVRADGSVKPAGAVVSEIATLLEDVDLDHFAVPKPTAALVVPSLYGGDYPFPPIDKRQELKVLLQAYTLARQAGIPTGFLYEPPLPMGAADAMVSSWTWTIPPETKLLVLPSTVGLTAPGWDTLERWVRDGGTLYASYRHGWWAHRFEEMFGCQHHLRCGDLEIPAKPAEWTFKRAFGPIAVGERLRCASAGDLPLTSICPVEPTMAEVVAEDGQGRPALLLNRLEAGRAILSAYPLEYSLAMSPQFYKTDATYRFYQGLLASAGVVPHFLSSHPCVECAYLEGEGQFLVWLINHSWERAEGTLITPIAAPSIQDLATDQLVTMRFSLDAKQVRAFRVVA